MRKRLEPQAAAKPAIASLLGRQDWKALAPHLERAGADVEGALARLHRYAEELVAWNRGVSNLISRNDEGRFVSRHLLESLEPAAWLREAGLARWVDCGSGGGLPGIPLAIAGVGERWTLVEARRPKTLFMRKMVEVLELKNVEVVHARIEDLALDAIGAYDGFVSRATMQIAPTLTVATALVRTGGAAFLWKGSRREDEMRAESDWRSAWREESSRTTGTESTVVLNLIRV